MEIIHFHLMPWQRTEDAIAWPYSEDKFDPAIGGDLYETYFSQLEYSEELGFDTIGFNEHHYTAYGLMPGPNLVAAHMAARTDEIGLAVMGNVLPIRGNPIRVAEEMAMLDNISDGRMTSGFVRGIPTEYAAYNVDPDESRGRFEEAWELVVEAWTAEEPFDWDGEFWQYDDVYIWPRPKQDPHPPLWMPAESRKSIEWAAKKRVPMAQVYVGTENLVDSADYYRQVAREEYGWEPTEEYFSPCRPVYVAETMGKARAEAEEHLEFFYDTLFAGLYRAGAVQQVGESAYREDDSFSYADHTPEKGKKAMNFDFDELQETGEIIVGSPEYVVGEIERQYEAIGGFGTFIGLFQFGTLPDDLVRRNLERFSDDVMPEVRSLTN
ncbi:LLM class flavin-dependent oxidoreductase [Halorarum halobium]|uniref:LLM class flavin-dependent oxidoreductase n=1 Tax=Halorarum halobium TaxID=3075121 RepID=UPI0028A7E38F|nr:LLM class flavin-dependent oxidoreductase [Halobaculum sp. XH14]